MEDEPGEDDRSSDEGPFDVRPILSEMEDEREKEAEAEEEVELPKTPQEEQLGYNSMVWAEALFKRFIDAISGRGGVEAITGYADQIDFIDMLTPLRQRMKNNDMFFQTALSKCNKDLLKRPLLIREDESYDILGFACENCGKSLLNRKSVCGCGGRSRPLAVKVFRKLRAEGLRKITPESVLMDVAYDRLADAYCDAFNAFRLVTTKTAELFGWEDRFRIENPELLNYMDHYFLGRLPGESKIPREEKEVLQFLVRGNIVLIPLPTAFELIRHGINVVKYGYMFEVLGCTGADLRYKEVAADFGVAYDAVNKTIRRELYADREERKRAKTSVNKVVEGVYAPFMLMPRHFWENGTIANQVVLEPVFKMPIHPKADDGSLQMIYAPIGKGKTFLLSSIVTYAVDIKHELVFNVLGDKSNSFTLACMPMFGYNARTNALVKRLEEDLGVQPHAIPTLNLVFLRKSETVPNDKTTNPPTKYDRIIRIDDPHDFEVPFDLIMDEFKKIVKDFDYAKAVGTINVRNLDRVIRLGTRESENIDVQIAINILTKFDGWRKSDLTQSMRILIDEMSYVAPSQVMLYAGDASRSGATISDFLKESRRDNASVDGASLDYTENVVIVDKGCLKQVRIGDLVDSKFASVVPAVGNNADFAEGDGSILVPAFDPDSLKIGFFPVTSFVRHLPKKLCEVKLERGKSIRPTFDESLFTLSPDGAVESVRVDCVKVGSFVACPSKLPQLHSQPKRLNLVDEAIAHFGDDVLSKLFIQPDNIRKFLIAKFGVTDLCKRRLDERHRLSLLSFKKNFERSTLAILDLEDARLGTCGCTNNVPVAINLDCDVYWLLGLIVADGNMSQNRIVEITCGSHELDFLEKASVIICRVFGVKGAIYKEYRGHECAKYSVSSSGLYWALRVLGVNPEGKGRRSKILHIPKLVLNASGDEIKAFLRGFWDGDGTKVNSRPKIDIGTTRLTIADELVHLFLLIGLNPFIYPQKTRRGIFYRVIVENTTITNLIRSYTKNDRLPCFNAVKNIVDKLHDTGIIKSFGRQKLRTDADLNRIYRLSRMWARRHTTPTKRTVHGILSILEKKPYYEVVRSQCESLKKLLLADIDWLRIKEIQEKQCNNYVYDLEVKIGNRKINNFVAGIGAVFCHNTQRPLEIITDVRDSSTNVFFRELPSSKDKSKSQIDFILESVQLYDPSVRPVVRDINNRGLLSNGTYWFWWNKQTRSINVLRPTPPTFCLQDPKKTPAQIIKMYEKDTGEQILLGSWDEVPELAHAVSEVHRERSIVN